MMDPLEERFDVEFGKSWRTAGIKNAQMASWGFKVLRPVFSKFDTTRLKKLDISSNQISTLENLFNATQFPSLIELKLNNNKLTDELISIPSLEYLDLSFNYLTAIPTLDGIPQLKELQIQNNLIEQLDDAFTLQPLHSLRILNLNNNLLGGLPSEFYNSLLSLNTRLPKLKSLEITGNPIIDYFAQYRLWIGSVLKSLNLLNGDSVEFKEDLSPSTGGWYKEEFVVPLEKVDDIYLENRTSSKDRTKAKNREEQLMYAADTYFTRPVIKLARGRELAEWGVEVFARAHSALAQTDGVLDDDPTLLQKLRSLVYEKVSKGDTNQAGLVIDGLSKMASVPSQLGNTCVLALKDLALINSNLTTMVVKSLQKYLIPQLSKEVEDAEEAQVFLSVLDHLANLKDVDQCGDLMSPLVANMRLIQGKGAPVVLRVLSTATEATVVECIYRYFHIWVCQILLTEFYKLAKTFEKFNDWEALSDIAVDGFNVARLLGSKKRAADYYVSTRFTTNLAYPLLRSLFRGSNSSTFTQRKASMAGALLGLSANLLSAGPTTRKELQSVLHVDDIYAIVLFEEAPHVLCLEASLKGTHALLKELAKDENELENFNRILRNILESPMTFLEILKGSLLANHMQQIGAPEISNLESCNETEIAKCYGRILELVDFFLKNQQMDYCSALIESMTEKGLIRSLCAICSLPNVDIKELALRCLSQLSVSSFTSEDLDYLRSVSNLLSSYSNSATSQAVVNLTLIWQKIVTELSDTGIPFDSETYCKSFPTEICEMFWNMLKRIQYVESSSEHSNVGSQNVVLAGRAIIGTVIAASLNDDIRRVMRSSEGLEVMKQTLIVDESLSIMVGDLPIEQSWLGRDVFSLGSLLLQGAQRLHTRKKVALRVCSRIADISCGVVDHFKGLEIPTIQQICAQESGNFPSKQEIRQNLLFLPNEYFKDRNVTLQRFLLKGHLDSLVQQLQFGIKNKDARSEQSIDRWARLLRGAIEECETATSIDKGLFKQQIQDLMNQVIYFCKEDTAMECILLPSQNEVTRVGNSWLVGHVLGIVRLNYDELAKDCKEAQLSDKGVVICENLAKNLLRNNFILAAYLRLVYSLLISPVSVKAFVTARSHIRSSATLKTLETNLISAAYDVVVLRKLFQTLNMGIRMDPHQVAESMDLIVPYGFMTKLVQQLNESLRKSLRDATVQPLTSNLELLLKEICQSCDTVARQLRFVKFSDFAQIQSASYHVCRSRFFNEDTTKLLVDILAYVLLTIKGTVQGQVYSHVNEQSALRRDNMFYFSISALSHLISLGAVQKLLVFRQLFYVQVIRNINIPKYLYFQIIVQSTLHSTRDEIEKILSSKEGRPIRLLYLDIVFSWSNSKWQQSLLGVTQAQIIIFSLPPNFNTPDSSSTFEGLNKTLPRIIASYEFVNLIKIISGYPSSLFLGTAWLSAEAEVYQAFVAPTLHSAEALVEILRACSGVDENSRIPVGRDVVSRDCLESLMGSGSSELVGDSFEVSGFAIDLSSNELLFCALTNTQYYELNWNANYWFATWDNAVLKDKGWIYANLRPGRRIMENGLTNFIGFASDEVTQEKIFDLRRKMNEEEATLAMLPTWAATTTDDKRQRHEQLMNQAKSHLLKMKNEFDIEDLESLTTGSGQAPTLSWQFNQSEKALERSYPSVNELELWKRLLAKVINAKPGADKWRRVWKAI